MTGNREHEILTVHPLIAEHRKIIADRDVARQALQNRAAEERRKHEQEHDEWRKIRDEALRTGKPIPPEPVEPESVAEYAWQLIGEVRDLRRAEVDIISPIADEIQEQAFAREPELLAAARAHVAALAEIADELDALLATLDRPEVWSRHPGPSRSSMSSRPSPTTAISSGRIHSARLNVGWPSRK